MKPIRGSDTSRGPDSFCLSVVLPCYNEEAVVERSYERLVRCLEQRSDCRLEIVFVNDGSTDGTGEVLAKLAASDPRVVVIDFTRNFGHQPALSAGLAQASGEAVVLMDADLQDPPEVILQMIQEWTAGYLVVYGIRTKRKEDMAKRLAYWGFYRIFRLLAYAPLDAGDFSLLDRVVVDVLNALPERNRFLRGLRAWSGFPQTGVIYERAARAGGESKYGFFSLVKLAFDGVFSFSTIPLTLVFLLGCGTALLSVLGLVFIIIQRVFEISVFGVSPSDVPGFATIVLTVLLIGGIQLVSLGIVGEYIGRIYQEVKSRPEYVIQRRLGASKRRPGQRDNANKG